MLVKELVSKFHEIPRFGWSNPKFSRTPAIFGTGASSSAGDLHLDLPSPRGSARGAAVRNPGGAAVGGAALPRRAGLHVTGDASTDADGLGDASAARWGSTTASRWSLELGHGGKVPGIGVSAKILEVDLQSIFGSKCILQVAGTSHVASLRAVAR